MARRRYQSGQLTDNGKSWTARWREDVMTAKGIQRTRRKETWSKDDVPTKKEAQRKLAKILEHINSVDYKPLRRETFASFAQRFIEDIMSQDKPSSQQSEGNRITRHLIPAFGQMNLKDIQAEMLQHWISSLRMKELSPKSIRNLVGLFKFMWKSAENWGYVQHDPFRNLKLPKRVKTEVYHFTIEETLAIIDQAKGRDKILFRTLAETGMRPGELAGLRIEDLGVRTLSVKQSIWKGHTQTPKSRNAIRTCAISTELDAQLRTLVQDPNVQAAGLLFPQKNGRPLNMNDFHLQVVKPILISLGIYAKVKALGIRRVGNYAFRHMNATQLSTMRVPLATIQKRIGHGLGSDVTHEHYIHSVSKDELAAADALGELLTPKREGESVQ